jgi:hypothetical protein
MHAPGERRTAHRPSEVFVVWFGDRVLLMVDGATPPDEDDYVEEVRASVVAAGVAPRDIDVIWSSGTTKVAQGTSL